MKELEMKNSNMVSIEKQHKLPALPLRKNKYVTDEKKLSFDQTQIIEQTEFT